MTESIRWVRKPEPFQNEGLASHLRHFARDNFLRSRRALLQAIEVSPAIRLDASEVGQIARAIGLPPATMQQMAPSDIPPVPALRRSLTRPRGDAVCPECLKKASYSRRVWSHQLATACPEHVAKLVDQCPGCGTRLRYDRPLAHVCDCGHDLRTIDSAAADPIEVEVASLLEGNIPAVLTLPLDLSGGVPPDIDLFLLECMFHFGFEEGNARPLTLPGATPAPRSLEHARERLGAIERLTTSWPQVFSGAVSELIAATPHRRASGTVSARLGSWYRFLFRRFRHPAYNAFRTAAANTIVLEHDGPIDPRKRELLAACTLQKEWLPLAQAARELCVNGNRLAKGADDGRIKAFVPDAAYRQRAITRTELERLRAVRADFCDKTRAAAILGVPASVFSVLAEAGLFTIHDPATLPPVTQGCVSRAELQALADRLRANVPTIESASEKHIALRELNLRRTTDRQRLVGLCSAIADGSFPAAGQDGTGLVGGLLFSKPLVQERVASFSVELRLNAQQISALTGAHYDSVKTWMNSGLLPAQRTNHSRNPQVVELRDFVRFLLEYSPLATLASQTGTSSRAIANVLDRRKLPVVCAEEGRGLLVRVRDLVQP